MLGRAVEGSASAYGFGVSPGVDVELSDRLTYRVAGMASFWFSEGGGWGQQPTLASERGSSSDSAERVQAGRNRGDPV